MNREISMDTENPRLGPVSTTDRIDSLDTLRGFALLGILAMNIQMFSMPDAAYFFPTVFGDLSGLNGLVWYLTELLASSKFITIFSLLFGAGIVLMNDRARARGRSFAGLHYRRMFWLLVIGLIHAYLLWPGDILVSYALCGLFIYLFRNVRPGRLVVAGLIFLIIGSSFSCLTGWSSQTWPEEVVTEFEEGFFPPPEEITEEIEHMRGGFSDQMKVRFPSAVEMQVTVFPFYMLWRGAGSMLLGMALFKWGVFAARARRKTYVTFIILGLLLGIPLTGLGIIRSSAIDWDPIPTFFILGNYNYVGSFFTALGWIGLIMLICQAGTLPGLRRRLAAVGQMALTNYLMHTVLCSFIFYGYGFALFGSVSRVEQTGITMGIWALQLWLSPVWLNRFRFGPMEWLWRSLSYMKKQPFRR
jgi:uncharacterized protein